MTGSVNKAILIGNLGRAPEVRATNDGMKIVTLNVATSESWKDKNSGERKEKVEWHRVVIFNEGLASVAEKYLAKGSKVYIEGQLQTRKWTDKEGVERFTTEIVLQKFRGALVLIDGKRGDDAGANEDTNETGADQRGGGRRGTPGAPPDLDDEIPFAPSMI